MPSNYELIKRENIREYGEGTRHLAFLGRLYNDRTHFIYELLQNAEDAGATRVQFDLASGSLTVLHDGRPFNEKDVRGVCGVGEGTKVEDLTKIGKFGIGFKSVYAYTNTPEVYSDGSGPGEFFRITHYVRPESQTPVHPETPWTTRFVFPFDRVDVPAQKAVEEIGDHLKSLDPRSLLFLRNIQELAWNIRGQSSGLCIRDSVPTNLPGRRIKVLSDAMGTNNDEEWHVFDREVPIPDSDAVTRVEVAFRVVPETGGGERIQPVQDSRLVVFFPTAVETHLGFLVQGAYQTTPARDNVPVDSDWNATLVQETGELIVETLTTLRDAGLLTVDVVDTLPLRPDHFAERSMFHPIYLRLREALQNEPLLPGAEGRFVAGRAAKLARGAQLVNLLTPQQLGELFGRRYPLHWLSTEITATRHPDLYRYLVGASPSIPPLVPDIEVRGETVLTLVTTEFLQARSDEWMVDFYRVLNSLSDLWSLAARKPIIRLEDGSQVEAKSPNGRINAFLPSAASSGYPTIRPSLVADEHIKNFLRYLGLAEPDLVTLVREKVLPKYAAGAGRFISRAEHGNDLQQIAEALASSGGLQHLELVHALANSPCLLGRNAADGQVEYRRPCDLYSSSPPLYMYFHGNPEAWFIAEPGSPLSQSSLEELQVRGEVLLSRRTGDSKGHVNLAKQWGWHTRGRDNFDPGFSIDGLDHALNHITPEKSIYIWNKLVVPNAHLVRGIVESSTKQSFVDAEQTDTLSKAGKLLIEHPWLLGQDGFHRPGDLSPDDLAPGYAANSEVAKALGMLPAALGAVAMMVDVSEEDLRFLLEHREEVADLRRKIEKARARQAEAQESTESYGAALQGVFSRRQDRTPELELPEAEPIPNPEVRRERTGEEIQRERKAKETWKPRFKQVTRSTLDEKDTAVRAFLREQYSGRCQICDFVFYKRDGTPYFEGLYLASRRDHRWTDRPGNVVCLCANCCAKMQFGSVEADDLRDQIDAFRAFNEGGDSRPELRIVLLSKPTAIHYTERHMLELQLMVQADLDESDRPESAIA